MIIKKIRDNSHFEFIKDYLLKEYGNRIIQINDDLLHTSDGFDVCLCEVADDNYDAKGKKGLWIYESFDNFRKYKVVCPFCKTEYVDDFDGYVTTESFNFCPNCGAELELNEDD